MTSLTGIAVAIGIVARHSGLRRVMFAAAGVALSAAVWAQTPWPTRPITLIVPFPAGGANDLPARELAAELSGQLGQQIVIDNPSGANGNIGAAAVARAQPDGYTFLFASPGVLATNRFMYKNMPFDPDRAFVPVILYAKSPLIIVANPKLPVHDLRELVDYAKANPGKLNAGIPSVGSQAHLTLELLAKQTGAKWTYVPYRGGANVNADLMGGQIDIGINFVPGLVGPVNDGSLRGLAVTTTARSKQFPNVPTVAESGLPGFESVAWYSVVGPAGTPRPIVDRLNALINAYLATAKGRQRLDTFDMQPAGGTPEDLAAYIAAEVAKWGPIIKAANITM
jgi:tripartite-type tricarboxylate transporter receptor subunit TctC